MAFNKESFTAQEVTTELIAIVRANYSVSVQNKLCIAISGLPSLGKTTIIKMILSSNGFGEKCLFVENKNWSKYDRARKLALGLTGLEPESYLPSFLQDIAAIKNGEIIEVNTYDHESGAFTEDIVMMDPSQASIIILEGCVWLTPEYYPVIDFALHVSPSEKYLWEENLSARDSQKRNCTPGEIKVRKKLFWKNYKTRILPHINVANEILVQYGSVKEGDCFYFKKYIFD